jgi:hypothetical protein
MNWANVESIQWKEEGDGRHTVNYKGSRRLPLPYVGEGGYSFTDEDFRKVYLELRNEERRGIPVSRGGYTITKPKPRKIDGLGQVARYLADEAMEKEDERRARVEDLEDRVKELEAIVATVTKDDDVIFKTAMEGNGDGTRQDGEEK